MIGALYIVLREPISAYRRHRREALSKAKSEELMMSLSDNEKDDARSSKEKDRGRDKKKEAKRRKSSLLRVVASTPESSTAGMSSIEVPPTSSYKIVAENKAMLQRLHPKSPMEHDITFQSTLTGASLEEHPPKSLAIPGKTSSPRAWEIPLPNSPAAGPSRLHGAEGEDISADNNHLSGPHPSNVLDIKSGSRGEGFSVIPDDGYLPDGSFTIIGKKKKRKGKGIIEASTPLKSPEVPSPLEQLLEERDRTIDSLRAQIGEAKAQEGKAREDAKRARTIEERATRDLERMRRNHQKADNEARRRESDVSYSSPEKRAI